MALPVTKNLIMENNKKEISLAEVRGLLLELIAGMSEAESRALLAELQKTRQPKEEPKEKRKHPRRKTFIHVNCSGERCAFTDFIQNISDSGLYIETQMPLFVNQELSMSFSPKGSIDSIKIIGKIVRIDSKGIGVQLNELLPPV
jgi:hypothetical protein